MFNFIEKVVCYLFSLINTQQFGSCDRPRLLLIHGNFVVFILLSDVALLVQGKVAILRLVYDLSFSVLSLIGYHLSLLPGEELVHLLVNVLQAEFGLILGHRVQEARLTLGSRPWLRIVVETFLLLELRRDVACILLRMLDNVCAYSIHRHALTVPDHPHNRS